MKQIQPHDRWVEQDPLDILNIIRTCATEAVQKLDNTIPNVYKKSDIAAVGITNQRETIVVWDKETGKPLHNAIGEFKDFFSILFFFHCSTRSKNHVIS